MKFEKNINLTMFTVEYIDRREEKPRTIYTASAVLDGGQLAALNRLGMRPAGYITQEFANDGFTVVAISKGETLGASVDLAQLWRQTYNRIERDRLQQQAKKVLDQQAQQQAGAETVTEGASV